MRVYRITAAEHAAAPLSGHGAAISGGRWNSPGTRIGYTTAYRSSAILEMLVHVARDCVPRDRVMVPIDLPDDSIEPIATLPRGWNRLPYSAAVQRAGDAWASAGRSLCWRVPNAIVAGEWNVLVNPLHPRAREIRVRAAEPLVLDPRLFDLPPTPPHGSRAR
ncbi:MAG: RES domain-containing protein [Xanthomonadales bacterium]|nr:RES domain-containing protein [Xanthomonadales bacterium]MCC6594985.1 RES family NAD+ phosphorylase [Rhodanobacteraceae bacterium]MDL1869601.1 RES domain-containing protein [Gammaproteobacteria bacterium PRO6]